MTHLTDSSYKDIFLKIKQSQSIKMMINNTERFYQYPSTIKPSEVGFRKSVQKRLLISFLASTRSVSKSHNLFELDAFQVWARESVPWFGQSFAILLWVSNL